jgi:hypothetical protein
MRSLRVPERKKSLYFKGMSLFLQDSENYGVVFGTRYDESQHLLLAWDDSEVIYDESILPLGVTIH